MRELLGVPIVGRDAGVLERVHAATSSARVKSMIQFVSHVSPPSSENACSHRGVGVVTPDHVKRTRIGRPLEGVVALEDSGVARERADHRRIEEARAAGCPPSRSTTPRCRGRRSGTTSRRTRRRSRCRTRPRSRVRPGAASLRPSIRTRPSRRIRPGAVRDAGCGRSTCPSRSRSRWTSHALSLPMSRRTSSRCERLDAIA